MCTMWDTYATNNTILYLQYRTCNTSLELDTYTTNNEILTLLTVPYSTATCITYDTDYIRYKNQKKKGEAGMYGKF